MAIRKRTGRVGSTGGAGLACSSGSSAFLVLVGLGTGAACCGAMLVSLLAMLLGASAATVLALNAHERLLVTLGYAVLTAGLLHLALRLHRVAVALAGASATPGPATAAEGARR